MPRFCSCARARRNVRWSGRHWKLSAVNDCWGGAQRVDKDEAQGYEYSYSHYGSKDGRRPDPRCSLFFMAQFRLRTLSLIVIEHVLIVVRGRVRRADPLGCGGVVPRQCTTVAVAGQPDCGCSSDTVFTTAIVRSADAQRTVRGLCAACYRHSAPASLVLALVYYWIPI